MTPLVVPAVAAATLGAGLLAAVALVVAVVSIGFVLRARQVAATQEADLHRDLHEQRLDIERREHRLAEREHARRRAPTLDEASLVAGEGRHWPAPRPSSTAAASSRPAG